MWDDWQAAAAELEARLGRDTLARALGIRPDEVEALAAGHDPGGDVLRRLERLRELDRQVDLTDPVAVVEHLGAAPAVQLFRRGRLVLAAFVALDVLVTAVIVAVFVLRA